MTQGIFLALTIPIQTILAAAIPQVANLDQVESSPALVAPTPDLTPIPAGMAQQAAATSKPAPGRVTLGPARAALGPQSRRKISQLAL